ncbi:endoplasmic reticulum retention protein [Gurleya vavrai]
MFIDFLDNLTRFSGDAFHIYTLFLLIHKIKNTRSCSGLSLKTQFLYMVIFVTRYIDLIYLRINSPLRLYLFIMKITYISAQALILFLIRVKYYYTYDKNADSFNILYLLAPSFILAFYFKTHTRYLITYLMEYTWCFSILLECVAILPQLVMLQETGEAEVLTSRYIFCLGVYRLLYVFGWIFKKIGGVRVDTILIPCGILQSILYADFFVLYYKYVFSRRGKTDKIPL